MPYDDRYLSPKHQKLAHLMHMLEEDIKDLTEHMKTQEFSDLPALDQQIAHVQLQTQTVLIGSMKHRLERATEA